MIEIYGGDKMTNEERVDRDFEEARKTMDDQAAAIVALAKTWSRLLDSLGHEICMGVRKGLFGKNAPDETSIRRM
jgi:hypothetical protein